MNIISNSQNYPNPIDRYLLSLTFQVRDAQQLVPSSTIAIAGIDISGPAISTPTSDLTN